MARQEDTKSRALRIDVPYHRRGHSFRRWDRVLTYFLPILSIAWIAFSFGRNGNEAMFSSGPVTSRHAFFENDCSKCHTAGFAAIPDAACEACHAGPEHHDNMDRSLTCVSCHVEHKANLNNDLGIVSDRHCSQCHEDLKVKSAEGFSSSKTYDPNIVAYLKETDSFPQGHAEVRLMAQHSMALKTLKGLEESKSAPNADQMVALKAGLDSARIRLNHKTHMMLAETVRDWRQPTFEVSASVPNHHGRARKGDRGFAIPVKAEDFAFLGAPGENKNWHFFQTRDGDSGFFSADQIQSIHAPSPSQAARCIDCHEAVSAGDYMAPISYERNCRDCHTIPANGLLALVPDEPLDPENKDSPNLRSAFAADPQLIRHFNRVGDKVLVTIPHEEFAYIRGYLREAVGRVAAANAGKIKTKKTTIVMQGKRRVPVTKFEPISEDEFVAKAISDIETRLYDSCKLCHEDSGNALGSFKVNDDVARMDVGSMKNLRVVKSLQVEPPRIPDRWFQHAEFDHAVHRSTTCVSCHLGSGGDPSLPNINTLSSAQLVVEFKNLLERARSGRDVEAEVLLAKTLSSLELYKGDEADDKTHVPMAKLDGAAKDLEGRFEKPEDLHKFVREHKYRNASVNTTDILLPPMNTCMECHKPQGGAQAGCVECHIYHDRSKMRSLDGYKSIDEMRNMIAVGARRQNGLDKLLSKLSGGPNLEPLPPAPPTPPVKNPEAGNGETPGDTPGETPDKDDKKPEDGEPEKKPEEPKPEAPKPEEKKPEEPKPEEKKPEEPKPEEKKPEEPKPEEKKPSEGE